MKIHSYATYTIDQHPNPEACYEWARQNWHDLHESQGYEMIDSLKAFAKHFGLAVDYSISAFGDRGDFIAFKGQLNDLDSQAMSPIRLWKHLQNQCGVDAELLSGNCPFTGVCYDEWLLDPIRNFIANPLNGTEDIEDLLTDIESYFLDCWHRECEYIYSDEGLKDLFEINEYEFTLSGMKEY